MFEDESAHAGLRLRTLPFTGFGAGVARRRQRRPARSGDRQRRGDAHGRSAGARTIGSALHQRRQLFRNTGNGRFEDVTARAGPAFASEEVGRGAAFGDLDNDGDTDIVVANDNGPVRLLVNNIGSRDRSWVGLRLVSGERTPRARRARRDRPRRRPTLWRRARADGSYGSANDPRVLVGLGATPHVAVRVQVFWPGGRVEEWTDLPSGRYVTLVEGTGRRCGRVQGTGPALHCLATFHFSTFPLLPLKIDGSWSSTATGTTRPPRRSCRHSATRRSPRSKDPSVAIPSGR